MLAQALGPFEIAVDGILVAGQDVALRKAEPAYPRADIGPPVESAIYLERIEVSVAAARIKRPVIALKFQRAHLAVQKALPDHLLGRDVQQI